VTATHVARHLATSCENKRIVDVSICGRLIYVKKTGDVTRYYSVHCRSHFTDTLFFTSLWASIKNECFRMNVNLPLSRLSCRRLFGLSNVQSCRPWRLSPNAPHPCTVVLYINRRQCRALPDATDNRTWKKMRMLYIVWWIDSHLVYLFEVTLLKVH